MEQTINITINRQFGSGGRVVGEKLAAALNFEYVDRNILAKAAEVLGVTTDHLKDYEEKAPSLWEITGSTVGGFGEVRVPYYYYPFTNDTLYMAEKSIIEQLAEEKNCVFVGRCANAILEDVPNCVHIYLYADLVYRKQRIANVYKFESKHLGRDIKRIDQQRARYYENYTDRRWGDLEQYDLAINTAIVGIDGAVELIQHYLTQKFNLKVGNKEK